MEGKKKLLMIASGFPPNGKMGSIRTVKFAKNLPEYGWIPTVLTISNDKRIWTISDETFGTGDEIKIIRAFFPDLYSITKRLFVRSGVLSSRRGGDVAKTSNVICRNLWVRRQLKSLWCWLRFLLTFPDTYNLWVPFAVFKGYLELKSDIYHIIYSTSPSITDHVIAAILHKLTGLPWVADFRDPWSQNAFIGSEDEDSIGLPSLERNFEKKLLSGASSIITVSQPLADLLYELHSDHKYGVRHISSGFDPEDYQPEIEVKGNRFYITYCGTLLGLKRNPTILLEAIGEMIDEGIPGSNDIVVRFYGPREEKLLHLLESFGGKVNVESNGIVSRKESIARQQESTIILIMQWDNPYTRLIYGGKIFEHLGARRPVIAITHSRGVLADLIHQTRIGKVCSTKDQVKEALRTWLEEYRLTGYVKYQGAEEEVDKYRWDIITGELVKLLDAISNNR